MRADQFQPQLYDLSADVAELRDVSQENQQVAQQLATLLERYRQGDYSRELPPPPPPRQPEAPLESATGKVVRRELFAAMPSTPWVVVRGQWQVRDGVLRGGQKAGDRVGAALRCPLGFDDGDIEYELDMPPGASHTLRLQGSRKDDVFLIRISSRGLALLRQATEQEPRGAILLAEERLRLKPGDWAQVHVQFRGEQLSARRARPL